MGGGRGGRRDGGKRGIDRRGRRGGKRGINGR